ncbi:MAG: ABC transporter substrate-binding protein [Cardiobacteriaceae bacterium]|nr:ABC transporter substrate-binding protein [Cardiobacteriaceae bacterium]
MRWLKMIVLSALWLSFAAMAAEKVKVGYIALPSQAPTFIALSKGYFATEGLDAELVAFQAAQAMAVAIASGDIDYGVTAVSGGLLNLAARGDTVRIFGGALQEASGVQGHKIIASKQAYDADLTKPDALNGKRFAITTQGSSFDYMGRQIAAQLGFQIQTVALNNMPAIAAALQAGKVDAAVAQPGIADDLIAKGAAVQIGNVVDFLPDYQVTVLFTSAAKVKEKPQEVAAFKRAFAHGAADYNAAFVKKTLSAKEAEALVGIIHQYVYTTHSAAEADKLIRDSAMLIAPEAALNRRDVLQQIDWFKAQKIVPDTLDGNALLVE